MTEPPPINPTEVILSSGAQTPPKPPPQRKSGFKTWWLLKKWAWRNTAALVWLLLAYSGLSGVGSTVGVPSVTTLLTPEGLRILFAGAALWLLLICEFQLHQVVLFSLYVLSFPIWILAFGIFHYMRNRLSPTLVLGRSRFKTRILPATTAVLLIAVFLWWPLPSSQVALLLGLLALVPGFYVFRRTLAFCLATDSWMHRQRTGLHDLYKRLKEQKTVIEKDPAKQQAARKGDALKAALIAKYESSFLGAVDRDLMRWPAIIYFCILFLASFMYLGFLAALWLRGLAGSPDALAAAIGRQQLPNLIFMAFICSLGVLGEWRIETSHLPSAASAVVFILNFVRIAAAFLFGGAFWVGYGKGVRFAEAPRRSPPGPEAGPD